MKRKASPSKGIKKHLNSHAREIALQGIYQVSVGQKSLQEEVLALPWIKETLAQGVQEHACALLKEVYQNYQKQETFIQKYSHKDLSQISAVVSAILHIGLCELARRKLSHTIIIDDLLELVRKYDGEESVAFVNGILDAYHQEHKEEEKKV